MTGKGGTLLNKKHDIHRNSTNRRTFLRRLSAGTAGLSLAGLAPAHVRSAPVETPDTSTVHLVHNTDRREAVHQALKPLEREVAEAIGDRRVVIKVNAGLAAPQYAINSTRADHIRGILDFLKPIHDRQVIITEGTAGAKCSAFIGFENYGYLPLEKEYNAKLVDANLEPYTLRWIRAAKHHPEPINIINMFLDPNVYFISAALMKTHNAVVGTYSFKNMAMGAPVCHLIEQINEKSKMHGGPGSSGGRELSYNMFLLAGMGVRPDLSVIDGIEAIEGNGPWAGSVVEHGVVIASTDFVAADRLCTELMGIDPRYMKCLAWCSDAGMGNFDLEKVRVVGPDYRKHIIKYTLNKNIKQQVDWINENFEE